MFQCVVIYTSRDVIHYVYVPARYISPIHDFESYSRVWRRSTSGSQEGGQANTSLYKLRSNGHEWIQETNTTT